MIDRTDPQWYRDAIIYQVHVKSFFDANNDGIGDFDGLTAKLDYIRDLGVTAIWVMPFYPSPLRDDGYDIADYRDINQSYGTMDQFRTFVDEAHAGAWVITELVINHTSDQHPWFQQARNAPRVRSGATSTSGRTPTRSIPTPASSSSTPSLELDLGSGRQGVLLAPLLLAPARPELRQPEGSGRGNRGDALLARHGGGRVAPRRDPLPDRARRHQLRESARDPHGHQEDPRRPRRILSRPDAAGRGQSGRRRPRSISATATNATWRSTSR